MRTLAVAAEACRTTLRRDSNGTVELNRRGRAIRSTAMRVEIGDPLQVPFLQPAPIHKVAFGQESRNDALLFTDKMGLGEAFHRAAVGLADQNQTSGPKNGL